MNTIGSRSWLRDVRREWERQSDYPFDPVRAFRRATLQEVDAQRPRRWWGGVPWKLHDREQRSALNPKFVAYLDNRLELKDWKTCLHVLKHRDLNWWADRLAEVQE